MSSYSAPNLNKISLGGLRAVAMVARFGKLRAAADELGVTPGAVSQQVLKVEAQLGRSLFERSSTGLVLTDIGREVFPLLEDGFNALDQALELTKHPADALTISVAPVFASRWLVPRLPALEAEANGLRVNVDAATRYVDPGISGIDACLRVTSDNAISQLRSDLTATWLAHQHVFPVCAPEIAHSIKRPSDLRAVPVIVDKNTALDWQIWLNEVGVDKDQLQTGTTYSDASLCIDAAIAGGGVFLAWDMLAVDAIARGALVKPLQTAAASGLSYWLVKPKRPSHSRRLRQLEEWLQLSIAQSL